MALELTSIADVLALKYDEIIDVRAPSEYADDHLPNAINLPVLDDDERAKVGTIYKQVSPFDARKIGAALVAKNAAAHLQGPLADRPGGWQPLVYCWRGGQRSGSFATILAQIGWRVEVIRGGYKTWRRLVLEALHDRPIAPPVLVLDGNTGSAKTAVLQRLPAYGVQVLDLEAIANHRGSLFGAMGGQPSQKSFESRLAVAIAQLHPARPVVIEAESSKIGNCRLPPRLWDAMKTAPRLVIDAPVQARADYLTRAYDDLIRDPAALIETVNRLRHGHAGALVDEWLALIAAGDFNGLARGLMAAHYDPRYAKHRARAENPATYFATETLDDAALDDLAKRISQACALHFPA